MPGWARLSIWELAVLTALPWLVGVLMSRLQKSECYCVFFNTILRHRNCSKQFQYFSLTLFACGCYLILFPTYLSFLFVKFESFDHLFATKVICLLIPIMVCLFQCGSLLWHYWPCACGMLAMNPELTIGTVFYRFLAWLAW